MSTLSLQFQLVRPASFRGDTAETIYSFSNVLDFSFTDSAEYRERKEKHAIKQAEQHAQQYLMDNWIEGAYDLYLNGAFVPTMIIGVERD